MIKIVLIIKASLASAEVSAGAVAKADQNHKKNQRDERDAENIGYGVNTVNTYVEEIVFVALNSTNIIKTKHNTKQKVTLKIQKSEEQICRSYLIA